MSSQRPYDRVFNAMEAIRYIVSSLLMLLSVRTLPALSSPVYLVFNPSRPAIASEIHATAGVFVNYALITDADGTTIAQRMTLFDLSQHKNVSFTVALGALIDGMTFQCPHLQAVFASGFSETIVERRLCQKFPEQFVTGRTVVALVWWKQYPPPGGHLWPSDANPATDEIHIIDQL